MAAPEDRTLYCTHCGISFVWTREEQQVAQDGQGATPHAPALCSGCQYLTPAPGRARGIVRWYNARRGYGFITRGQGPEIFAHVSELRDGPRLAAGALVEFAVGETERGPAAQAIHVLAGVTPAGPSAGRA